MKNMFTAMLLSLLTLVPVAQAEEEQGEWYIGGYLYYVETRGSDEKLFTPAGQGADPDPITPGNQSAASTQHFHSQYDKAPGYGIVFGYDFAGALRGELALRQFTNDITEFNDGSGSPVLAGEAEVTSLMANVWFDFNRDASWRPYIGFGAGLADVSKGNQEDDVTMVQVGAGVNVDLTERLVLDIGYRYMDADESEYELDDGRSLKTEYTANAIALGLRYGMGSRGPAPDADGDGVADSADECPGTPAGRQVDAKGCEFDSDGDGVVDGDDACPSTEPGAEVLSNGCAVGQKTVLRGVNFEFDSAILTYNAKQILDTTARTLLDSPTFVVELQGHTDDQGPDEYNQGLSERRAAAVRRYLMNKGVDGARLLSEGLGETRPIASNNTRDGRAQNRRVELHLVGDDASGRKALLNRNDDNYEYKEEPTVEELPAAVVVDEGDAADSEDSMEAAAMEAKEEPAPAPAAEEEAAPAAEEEEPMAKAPAEEQESFESNADDSSYDAYEEEADSGGDDAGGGFDPYAAYE